MMIYRQLIRSRLDYGAEAFYTASQTQLARLDRIQSKCLSICCGAFCGTAVSAMQQECGEMPLNVRRKRSVIRFALKVAANPSNPAKEVTELHWKSIYGRKYETGKEPIYIILRNFIERHPGPLPALQTRPVFPPWKVQKPHTDIFLSDLINKKRTSTTVMKALSESVINQYTGALCIYTDASKSDEGKVAAAFYVEDLGYGHSQRLPDNVSICTGELAAISMAIDWLSASAITTDSVIFTDSLSSVVSLRSGLSATRPRMPSTLLNKFSKLVSPPKIVWIPSHIGINGNVIVDQLAKEGTEQNNVEFIAEVELRDALFEVDRYITDQWQEMYTRNDTGAFYRELEPLVSTKIKYINPCRSKERLITRLRLGKCCLNKYLHQINKHEDGRCDTCGVPETIEHFLLHCQNSGLLDIMQTMCRQIGILPTIQAALKYPNTC